MSPAAVLPPVSGASEADESASGEGSSLGADIDASELAAGPVGVVPVALGGGADPAALPHAATTRATSGATRMAPGRRSRAGTCMNDLADPPGGLPARHDVLSFTEM